MNNRNFLRRCKSIGGSFQWNTEEPSLPVCVKPRKRYEDKTIKLFKLQYPKFNRDEKIKLVEYFRMIYPDTDFEFWNQLSLDKLQTIFNNLEIWYRYPGAPDTPKVKRTAPRPFYRIPESIELQQRRKGKKGYKNNRWVEVYHYGDLNTDFFIPPEKFAGTYYYPAVGSGVYLNLGKSLVALNKADALNKLKVPFEEIAGGAGDAFYRWVSREYNEMKKPNLIKARDKVINNMIKGQNVIEVSPVETCYYGLGDDIDAFLGNVAKQNGYDTIQLLQEAQKGCTTQEPLIGFEIIDLRTPDKSADNLLFGTPIKY